MKRKFALLMAIVMVIAMLPVVALADDVAPAGNAMLVGPVLEGSNQVPGANRVANNDTNRTTHNTYVLSFTPGALSGLNVLVPHEIRIELLNGRTANETNRQGFWSNDANAETGDGITNAVFATSSELDTRLNNTSNNAEHTRPTRNLISIMLDAPTPGTPHDPDNSLPTESGRVTLTLSNVAYRGNEAQIRVTLRNLATGIDTVIAGPVDLVRADLGNAVTIAAGDVVTAHESVINLNNVQIRETQNSLGRMAPSGASGSRTNQAVRVTAPAGFRFVNTPALAGVNGTLSNQANRRGMVGGRDTAVLRFDQGNKGTGVNQFAVSGVNITNLQLIADVGTAVENVYLDVELGWFAPTATAPTGTRPNEEGEQQAAWDAENNAWIRFRDVDNPQDLQFYRNRSNPGAFANRSGDSFSASLLVATRVQVDGEVTVNGPAEPVTGISGRVIGIHSTAARSTIEIVETVPTFLLMGHPTYEIRLRDAGVRFRDDANPDDNDTRSGGLWWGVTVPGDPANPRTGAAWSTNEGNRFVGSGLTGNRRSILIRPNLTATAGSLHTLSVRYALSTDIGWAGGETREVWADVFRNGVNVGEALLATVTDPIVIGNVNTARLNANMAGVLAPHVIPSITITETAAGQLQRGDIKLTLEARIGGQRLPMLNPPMLSIADIAVTGGNLLVGDPDHMTNEDDVDIVTTQAFAIERQSAGAAATITLQNVSIQGGFGNAFSGMDVEFVLLISGDAIGTVGDGYEVVLISERGTTAQAPGGVTPIPTTPFFANMPGMATSVADFAGAVVNQFIAQPFLVYNNVSYLQLRAFAELISADVHWDQATRTASVRGHHFVDGDILVVALTMDQANAMVTRGGVTTPVDIASANPAYQAPGTVTPMQIFEGDAGRTFLPARFLAQTFGLYVGFDTALQQMTIGMQP